MEEPLSVRMELKQKTDSLSKISGKSVVGYLFETNAGKKTTTIFYEEDGKIKSMILKTLSKELPSGDTNWRINSVGDTSKRRVLSNND